MKSKEKWTLIALLIFLAAALIGIVRTRPESPQLGKAAPKTSRTHKRDLVDEQALQTARTLALLAYNHDEHRLARRALSVADDTVDLAFETALRDAAVHPRPADDEARSIEQRIATIQRQVAADQQQLEQLKNLAPNKRRNAGLEGQLDLAEAQLTFDQEDLGDAGQDLIRAGGDVHSALKRMLEEHEASHKQVLELPSADPVAESWPLVSHFRAWKARRSKLQQIAAAEREAEAAVASLTQSHDELEQRIRAARSGTTVPASPGSPAPPSPKSAALMRTLGEDMKSLADYDKRIQDERELSEIYRDWGVLTASYQRSSEHGGLQCVLWIALIGLGALIATHLVGRLEGTLGLERRRMRSLHVVARFAVQAVGLLLVLLVVFGAPSEMTTMLGLAGAGLTVALKDFIVAFFGWFVLMGKNGIRIGDWVEIDGIGGEVVEIGFLRTVLLETGQWSDAGHPTGRKVAFVNSFAVEGHYFNFSTSGQWLWDELQVLVPPGVDPYHMLQAIQERVIAETSANARAAEQEWQRVTSGHALQVFSAAPAINLKPTSLGIEIVVRYIAQAHQRYELRGRLNAAMVELLRSKDPAALVSAQTAVASP